MLALLADSHWRAERREEGLNVLADALAQVEKTENRSHEAELYRLKGTLTNQTGVPGLRHEEPDVQQQTSRTQAEAEAETCFHGAIEIARRQRAKSFELRAVTSLARLWQQQGKNKEARKILAEIYGWFTEGFDTPDLKDAEALLDELSAQTAMRCTKCRYENPADALFCMKCGAKIEHRCAWCGTRNPNDANFCRKCGAALGTSVAAAAPKDADAKAQKVEHSCATSRRSRGRAQDSHCAVRRYQRLN
jgi:ribosomal protein L40E